MAGLSSCLYWDGRSYLTDLLQRTLSEQGDYEVRVAASALEAGGLLDQSRLTTLEAKATLARKESLSQQLEAAYTQNEATIGGQKFLFEPL